MRRISTLHHKSHKSVSNTFVTFYSSMHELGIAQDLFGLIKQKTKEFNLKRVTKVRIKIGVASGIDKEFLKHSFLEHIFPKNNLNNIELELIDEDVLLKCRDCVQEIDSSQVSFKCPFCGSSKIEIVKGNNVYVENIEGE